jgi:phage-related protein
MRQIVFYKSASGQSPIDQFLDRLSAKQAQKVTWVLRLVEELPRVPSQYFKKLAQTEDLWEIRVKERSNIFRLLSFFDGPRIVVLVHAFQKKTQKTPLQAIDLAERRKRDYLRRKRR